MADTYSTSFVVRLRVDVHRQDHWWGEAQHIETGERIAFREQEKLLEFLRRHVRALGAGRRTRMRR